MTEPTPSSLPTARVDTPRRFRIPLVWVIPLVAALIGVFLALHTWYQQGPDITIRFKTGEGLEAGKTRIKYKDVDVGQIDSVTLAEDGSYVIAGARLARSADHLLVDDTRFWMVSARVSGSAVSGLGTLLSGTYVGLDAGKSAEARREFTALDDAPVVSFDVPGRYFTLHAETLGSIGIGTPVYFRRMQAGQGEGGQGFEEVFHQRASGLGRAGAAHWAATQRASVSACMSPWAPRMWMRVVKCSGLAMVVSKSAVPGGWVQLRRPRTVLPALVTLARVQPPSVLPV